MKSSRLGILRVPPSSVHYLGHQRQAALHPTRNMITSRDLRLVTAGLPAQTTPQNEKSIRRKEKRAKESSQSTLHCYHKIPEIFPRVLLNALLCQRRTGQNIPRCQRCQPKATVRNQCDRNWIILGVVMLMMTKHHLPHQFARLTTAHLSSTSAMRTKHHLVQKNTRRSL